MSQRWRYREAQELHGNDYFRLVQSAVMRPDGSMTSYHTLDFHRPSVCIVAQDDRGQTVLVNQYRFIVDREVWALPSGGVDEGEHPITAAARELQEETGYAAGKIEHLLSYYPSYGVANQVFHCFLASELSQVRTFDRNEVDRTDWFTPDAIREGIRSGVIPDGFSQTPLLYLLAGLAPQPPSEIDRCRRVQPEAMIEVL